ncbi:hypothetical protein V2J09_013375 [Rumex salicifolius]
MKIRQSTYSTHRICLIQSNASWLLLSQSTYSSSDVYPSFSLSFKMISMAVQPVIKPYLPQISPNFALKSSPSPNSRRCHFHSLSTSRLKLHSRMDLAIHASAASEFVAEDAIEEVLSPAVEKQKLGVVVKPTDKPRLVLKFIWMEKNIGLGLDQAIPGHGTIPLSPYYFWPRKDAWEELKVLLESKPWISQKQMIILLNQATDIINLWQQAGGNLQ